MPFMNKIDSLCNIISAGDINFKTVMIDWHLTDYCQLNCDYCIAWYSNKKYQRVNDSWKHVLKKLKNILVPFNLTLIGGEPTTHPYLIDIIEEVSTLEFCKNIDIATNLYSVSSFRKISTNKLTLDASYHPQYDIRYTEKLQKLKDMNQFNVRANINIVPEERYIQKTLKTIRKLEDINIPFSLNAIQTTGMYNKVVTPNILKYFEEYIQDDQKYNFLTEIGVFDLSLNEIIMKGVNKFKGFKCNSLYFKIDIDGKLINMCTEEEFYYINDKKLDKSTICPLEKCSCDTMLKFYKVKI